jgi:hypothetical protein
MKSTKSFACTKYGIEKGRAVLFENIVDITENDFVEKLVN